MENGEAEGERESRHATGVSCQRTRIPPPIAPAKPTTPLFGFRQSAWTFPLVMLDGERGESHAKSRPTLRPSPVLQVTLSSSYAQQPANFFVASLWEENTASIYFMQCSVEKTVLSSP